MNFKRNIILIGGIFLFSIVIILLKIYVVDVKPDNDIDLNNNKLHDVRMLSDAEKFAFALVTLNSKNLLDCSDVVAYVLGINPTSVKKICIKTNAALKLCESDYPSEYREAFYSIGLSWRDMKDKHPFIVMFIVMDAVERRSALGHSIPYDFQKVFNEDDWELLIKMHDRKFEYYFKKALIKLYDETK